MSFDKPTPGAGLYPAMSDVLDDDDDEIVREVKMLSLVTAQVKGFSLKLVPLL